MRKATWALVFSILGLLLIGALIGIIFTIFSKIWIKQIKEELYLTEQSFFDFEGRTLIELAEAFNLATLVLLLAYLLIILLAITVVIFLFGGL